MLALPLDLPSLDSIDAPGAAARERKVGSTSSSTMRSARVFGHVERYSIDDWEASTRSTARGFFRITQVCLNGMLVESDDGNIITIA